MNEKMKDMLETLQEDQQKAVEEFPTFTVGTKKITVYGKENTDCPVLYANTIPGMDYEVWQKVQQADLPPFVYVAVTRLNWCTDLAPWYCPPSGPGDTACYPGAEAYLKILTEEIMPKAESMLSFQPKHRWLAGYSLAGLFAYWSLYHTNLFERLVCGSGSFWFPDFTDYCKTHQMEKKPVSVYFSLGRQESHTRYKMFNCVQTRTEWLEQRTKEQGIDTTFVLEPGNHYDDPAGRMLKGIVWTFQQTE